MTMKKLFLTAALATQIAFAAPVEINQFDSPAQEADYKTLIAELRCPQCQNNNIADSNATIATDMRAKTLELLKQGKSKQEVVDYMIERYGNFVTYDPPLTPATVLLWAMPVLLILLGFGILARRRKNTVEAVKSEPNVANHERLKAILGEQEK